MRKFYPSPEERALMVIKRLEQVIKNGKEERAQKVVNPIKKANMPQGMSYKKWQDAAKVEIAEAIRNAILDEVKSNRISQALLMLAGSCFATLGFLGAAVAWGSVEKVLVATTSIVIGFVLLFIGATWLLSGSIGEILADRRKAKIARMNNLNEQIKKMESYLQERQKSLKGDIEYLKR